MKVLGVDPGVTGAWAVIELRGDGTPELVAIGDLPVVTIQMTKRIARRLDANGCRDLLGGLLEEHKPDRVVVERLTGGPGITSTTAFPLGWTAAVLDATLSALDWGKRYQQASPSAWKRSLLVPADKSAAKARATKLFGSDKGWPRGKDHNRAEAALIALYGALSKPKR